MKRFVSLAVAGAVVAGSAVVATAGGAPAANPCGNGSWHGLCAGAGVADATWHVGAGGGQYASDETAEWSNDPTRAEWDPNVEHVKQAATYGVASRLTIRAIVLRSPGGAPVALVKNDNYLAQDMLSRRVAQLLADHGSKVTYDHLLISATHNHNSPYYATHAAGVWLFQDVMDLRMFEYQARQTAAAVEQAEQGMRPARMGATTVDFPLFQGNIAGAEVNEDGSPTGYPLEDNDHGAVVMRFDDISDPAAPKPIATWVNYAEHGESLAGYDLISADWLAPFERFVDRATGAPVVFSQGAVGSSEGPYDRSFPIKTAYDGGEPFVRAFGHTGYAQAERGTHLLAEHVIAAWQAIGGADNGVAVQVPYDDDPVVRMVTNLVPGPVSHPYPSVSNCRTGNTVDGDPGVPVLGLPDCARMSDQFGQAIPADGLWDSLRATGLPLPANYDATSFGSVEENARLKLQAVRVGEVLLASCACEPQSDLIRALETRTDSTQGNTWNGFDYANPAHVAAAWPDRRVEPCHAVSAAADAAYDCPDPRDNFGVRRLTVPHAAFLHMQAEINNPSDGWDDPSYAAQANSEPTDLSQIKGNFTSRELPASCGYALPVGLGHTGDYNGYTVSYREYMARDAYRKALTSYGPHTADYMVTRLMSLAANLKCGTPIPSEPLDAAAADEQRQQAEAVAIGQLSSYYFDTWTAQIPDNGGTAGAPVKQPAPNVSRFDAATFSWVGGDNWTDNPTVTVQRLVDGSWVDFADQSGEVQTVLDLPPSALLTATDNRTGSQTWTWTASFEVFDSAPRADVPDGQVPDGTYRFVVDGAFHHGGRPVAYHRASDAFRVTPWTGITVRDLRTEPDRSVSFVVDPIRYPRLPATRAVRPFYADDLGGTTGHASVCASCTFRPWASTGVVATARVAVTNAFGRVLRIVPAALGADGRWHADTRLGNGERAVVRAGDVRDTYGEINGVAAS